MNGNKVLITAVAFLSYMVMAGLLTQIGIVIGPMAQHYAISTTEAASMFSFLTGGTLIGTFLAMVIFDKLPISRVFQVLYIPLILALIILVSSNHVVVACSMLVVIGIGCGTGLSAGAVILSKTYNDNQRASAFIGTDCAFSASGFIFPSLTSALIAAGIAWNFGFAAVSFAAVLVLLATLFVKFPKVTKQETQVESSGESVNIWQPRVFIVGAALCVYLLTQGTFLTWAPSYLQSEFGLAADASGAAVGNYWGPSVFGLITAAILVNFVSARILLVTVTLIGIGISYTLFNLNSSEQFLMVTLGLGFCTSCMYKIGISVGSQQIDNAPPRLVTFLLCCGTVGSTLAPALSAQAVEAFGVQSAMLLTVVGFTVVASLFISCLILEKRQAMTLCKA
ncbi:MFS transporter TsgA [Shewanella marina]|uniref:MFS transporter TsgA n=1 Tax=Shewanella marina TaxID=487319 RepID=UPI000472697F|nr:MFS transporter TsgA [Shewanella marina]